MCFAIRYHPHGIIGLGALASNATLLPQMFPQLDVRLLTLETNMKIPWIREFYLWSGICSASKRSITNILTKGSSVMLVRTYLSVYEPYYVCVGVNFVGDAVVRVQFAR
jgi:hypothetical protein